MSLDSGLPCRGRVGRAGALLVRARVAVHLDCSPAEPGGEDLMLTGIFFKGEGP